MCDHYDVFLDGEPYEPYPIEYDEVLMLINRLRSEKENLERYEAKRIDGEEQFRLDELEIIAILREVDLSKV